MFDNYLLYIVFFTLAIIGITVPFFAVVLIRFVKRQTMEYGRQLGAIGQGLNDIKRVIARPLERLNEMEKRSRRLTERLEQLELRDQSYRQYDQAIKLIKSGTSVDEVMSSCGLNRGEVELICTMHEPESLSGSAN